VGADETPSREFAAWPKGSEIGRQNGFSVICDIIERKIGIDAGWLQKPE
jgi:hypothetical protein